jgi:hypothetical protein
MHAPTLATPAVNVCEDHVRPRMMPSTSPVASTKMAKERTLSS